MTRWITLTVAFALALIVVVAGRAAAPIAA
jgi:hypothetical protein